MSVEWLVKSGDREVTAILDLPDGDPRALFVCAHGAGGNARDRSMQEVSAMMRKRGVAVVRYNFPYRESGRGRPDPMPTLIETVRAVAESSRSRLSATPTIIGGRSMGGRAASMLAAEGYDCEGVLLLAYPLHPPGQPEKLRDAHLPRISLEVLCINGTRDQFCTHELMEKTLRQLGANWSMHWIEGADHGFRVPRASGRNAMAEAGEAVDKWLGRIV